MSRRVGVVLGLVFAVMSMTGCVVQAQREGGVHFGPYVLRDGEVWKGDLVVFGPVTLKEGAQMRGDLAAFGGVTVEAGAVLEGDLVAAGTVRIRGEVDGSLFSAGDVHLGEEGYVGGNISAVGVVEQAEGAVVEGVVTANQSPDEAEVFRRLAEEKFAPVMALQRPFPQLWLRWLWRVVVRAVRGLFAVVILTLMALVIVGLWPRQVARIGATIEQAPVSALGVGVLALLATGVVFLFLFMTICLAPIALLGMLGVGAAVLVGWVAMGETMGRRLWAVVAPTSTPTAEVVAVVGTALLTVIAVTAWVLGPLAGVLILLLLSPAAGAVVLTRLGTVPYPGQAGGV